MVDKLPKYRSGVGIGRTTAPKSSVPEGVTMLPYHNIHGIMTGDFVIHYESGRQEKETFVLS
jgi:hypothetical protein